MPTGLLGLLCMMGIPKQMDKELARSLLLLVNEPASREALNMYQNHRLQLLRTQLESTQTFEETARIQGQIKELRRLETLREEVTKAAE